MLDSVPYVNYYERSAACLPVSPSSSAGLGQRELHVVQIVADDLDAVRRASLSLSEVAAVNDEVPGTTIDDVGVVFREIQRKPRRYGVPIAGS